jgi:uncharacterized membrane protein (DUF4010 family)
MGTGVSIVTGLAFGDGPPSSFESLAVRGGIAMLLGLLVGTERQRSRHKGDRLSAGIRTFPIIGLLGFAAALGADAAGSPIVYASIALGFASIVVTSYVLDARRGHLGFTTETAALLVFVLGSLCHWQLELVAAGGAILATLLLSLKARLHGLARRVSREDLYATLKLAVVTVIILPLLPDRDMGPFGAWNPFRLWVYVVLIAAVSFAGYVAVRVVGARRGIALTGLLGGLVSSTAVALAFSRRSREEPRLAGPLAAAIVLASTIMFPRVLIVATVIHPEMAVRLWIPVTLMTLAGIAAGWVLNRRSPEEAGRGTEAVVLRNPFEMESAVKFGVFLAVLFVASRAAYDTWQEKGLYATSVMAGLTDVDAITVQNASDARDLLVRARTDSTGAEDGSLAAPEASVSMKQAAEFQPVAATCIILAMLANTLVKGALTVVTGSPELRRRTVPSFAALLVAGFLAILAGG